VNGVTGGTVTDDIGVGMIEASDQPIVIFIDWDDYQSLPPVDLDPDNHPDNQKERGHPSSCKEFSLAIEHRIV
jgi:hypothetical protein